MPAGRNGIGPACQHADVSPNEEEERRREARRRPGPLTNAAEQSGRLLLLTLVIVDLGFFLLKCSPVESAAAGLIGSASEQNIYSSAADNQKNKHFSDCGVAKKRWCSGCKHLPCPEFRPAARPEGGGGIWPSLAEPLELFQTSSVWGELQTSWCLSSSG